MKRKADCYIGVLVYGRLSLCFDLSNFSLSIGWEQPRANKPCTTFSIILIPAFISRNDYTLKMCDNETVS